MKLYSALIKLVLPIVIIISTNAAESSVRKFIYKIDREEIVLQICVSGEVNTKNECIGESSTNRIAAYYFMQILLSPYLIIDSDKLKPLTDEEKKAYSTAGIKPSEIMQKRKENLNHKLNLIKKLLKEEKIKDSKKILSLAEKQLIASDPSATHIFKLNELIQKVFKDKIDASNKQSIVESETEANKIFWRQFDSSIHQCGNNKSQTIAQRISSCSMSITINKDKRKIIWNLVARKRSDRNGKFYEVWKDSQTGLLWGDLYDKLKPYFHLVDVDPKTKVVKDKLCSTDEYDIPSAGLSPQNFSLPTIEEFEQALKNGISEVVPNMNNWFWSSTTFPSEYDDNAWGISNGMTQFRDFDFKYYYSYVRCVYRSKSGS